jgi:outer membrane protein
MRKKTMGVVWVAFFAGAFAMMSLAQEQKIAFLDLDKVIKESDPCEQNYKILDDSKAMYEKEMQKIKDDYDALKKKVDALEEDMRNPIFSEDSRTAIRTGYLDKQVELRKAEVGVKAQFEKYQEALATQESRMMKDLYKQVAEIVTEYALKEGYSAVINIGMQNALYVDPKLDISEAILARLNKLTPKTTSPAKAPAAKIPATNFPAANTPPQTGAKD